MILEYYLPAVRCVDRPEMHTAHSEARNLRASTFYLATSSDTCWRCKKRTKVFGVILPDFSETFTYGEDQNGRYWHNLSCETVYYELSAVAPQTLQNLSTLSGGHFRMDTYANAPQPTLMNHCEHCNSKLSERKLNSSSDSGVEAYPFAYVTHGPGIEGLSVAVVDAPFAAFAEKYVIYTGSIYKGCISQNDEYWLRGHE